MSSLLETRSSFFYGYVITAFNTQLDFGEGGPELTASLSVGSYTFQSFATEIARAMTATPGALLEYTVTANRDERTLNISSTSNFEILAVTGSHVGTSPFSIMGFTTDRAGTDTYTGDLQSGSEYRPQFLLQNYVDPKLIKRPTGASVNESASGIPEIVSFARINFTEFDIKWITDIDQGSNCFGSDIYRIETDVSGVDNALLFLDAITEKQTIEFMKDRSDKSTFIDIICEETKDSKQGVSYKLQEELSLNVPGYFKTGRLVFRVTS